MNTLARLDPGDALTGLMINALAQVTAVILLAALLSFFFVRRFVRETRGKELEEM